MCVQLSSAGISPCSHPRRIVSASLVETSRVQAYWPGFWGDPESSSIKIRVNSCPLPGRQASRLKVYPCPWKGMPGTS